MTRRLKILQVAHKFPPDMGGIEMHTFEVSRRMAALGHDVTVVTTDPSGKLVPGEQIGGVTVVRVPAAAWSGDALVAPGIFHAVARSESDVIHVQGFHTAVPPLAMAAAIRKKVPFAVTFHSGGHSSSLRHALRSLQRKLMRPLLSRASQLIGVSEFEADLFAKDLGLTRDAIRVVPNGAQIAPPSRTITRDPDRPLILSIGRLERYKGHNTAIDAFAVFRNRARGARLRIAGEGPYKQALRDQVRRLGLEDCVEIQGIPPGQRSAMAELMSSAALVVMLSEYEAHPVAALEAISLGRPVLALNATGFKEMVDKGEVLGVEPGSSPQSIAQALGDALDRPPPPPVAIPDWDDCTLTLLSIYNEIVERGHSTQSVGQTVRVYSS